MKNEKNKSLNNIFFPNNIYHNFPPQNFFNSLFDFNIIRYKGIMLPRFSFSNSRHLPDNSAKKEQNIMIDLNDSLGDDNENENETSLIKNENNDAIFSKRTSSSDLIKKEENKIIFTHNNSNNPKFRDNDNQKYNKINNYIITSKIICCNQNNFPNDNMNNNVQNSNEIKFNFKKYQEDILYGEALEIKENNNILENTINNKFNIEKTNELAEKNNIKLHKSKNLFNVCKILKSNENNNEEKNEFLFKKRGRKQTDKNKRVHSGTDDDNLQRKIQVHFISFITNYTNDIIRSFANSKNVLLFRNVDYKLKKVVSHKYFNSMKLLNIGEILQMKPSPKMKFHGNSVNIEIFNQICKLFPFMEDYFKKEYRTLFKEYFSNNSKVFIFNGKKITLSQKTRTFKDLINKNYAYKEKLKFVALHYFLDIDKNPNEMMFMTEKQITKE